jgi:hypothetical protein
LNITISSQTYNMDSVKNVLLKASWFSPYKTLQPTFIRANR